MEWRHGRRRGTVARAQRQLPRGFALTRRRAKSVFARRPRVLCVCGRKLDALLWPPHPGPDGADGFEVREAPDIYTIACDRCSRPWRIDRPDLERAYVTAMLGGRAVRLPL